MENDFINSPPNWSQQTHGDRAFIFDAFISHATGDKSSAIVEDLRGHGVNVWHDESQEMGDAMWRMRLVNALHRSRYIVLLADEEHDVLERDWVTAEWQSALEAELLSGVQRLVIAKLTAAARIPPALSMHAQFNIPEQSEALAQILKEGNQLPDYVIVKNIPLSLAQMFTSLRKAAGREAEESTTRKLYELIDEGLAETQSHPSRPSHALYVLWVFSHDSHALDELDICSLAPAIRGLEALAITGHYESRANSCFMLRALAKKGCAAAGEALRRVLRRQDHEDVLKVVYEWFLMDGETLPAITREDYTRILLVLPATATELAGKASESAPPEADPARLRHAVLRSTFKHFKKLKPMSKRHEAERRFQTLLDTKASPTTWEVFFRGLAKDAELEIPLVNLTSALPEQCVDTFLTLANRFTDEGAHQLGIEMWFMQYEVSMLRPLAIADAYKKFGERPLLTYRKFLQALKTPVSEDLKLIEAWQRNLFTEEDSQFATLLREELEARLAFIAFYLKGPHFERNDDGLVYVNFFSLTEKVEMSSTSSKLSRDHIFLESQKQPLARYGGYVCGGGSKHPTIVAIWDRWHGVPLI